MKKRNWLWSAVLIWCVACACGAASSGTMSLIDDLDAPVSRVRLHAATALGRSGDPAAVPALREALSDSDAGVRAQAARALGRIREDRVWPALAEALRDDDANVRMYAAYALGELKVQESAPALLEALEDPAWTVREQAAWAIRELRDPKTAEKLMEGLSDADASLERVVWIVNGLETPTRTRCLGRLLRSSRPEVRKRAVSELADLENRDAVVPLVTALDDTDPEVQEAAIDALVGTRDERAESALEALVRSAESERIRAAAEKALQELNRHEGLSAYYSFDDGDRHTVADDSGMKNDGVIKGAAPVKGKSGRALKFGGGSHVSLGQPPAQPISGTSLSVTAWVHPAAETGVVVARGGEYLGYALYLKDGKACFGIHRHKDGPAYIARGETVPLGEWSFLAGVVKEKQIEVYVNGELTGTAKTPGAIPGTPGQGMEIGTDLGTTPAEIMVPYEGIIDEVRVYHTALTPVELARQYAEQK